MDDDPDIIKQLRDEERQGMLLGSLQINLKEFKKLNTITENPKEDDVDFSEDSQNTYTMDTNKLESIDEKIQITVVLQDLKERYRALFNSSFELIYLHDLKGRFIDANPAAFKLLGYNKEELTMLNFPSLLDKGQLLKAIKSLNEIKKYGHQKEPVEYRLKAKNGSYFDVETTGVIVYRNGKPFAIQGIARDITEQKKAENIIKEREKKYRELVEGLDECVFRLSFPDGNYSYISPAAKSVFGYSEDDFLHTPRFVSTIIHPDSKAYINEKWNDFLNNKVHQILEYKIIDPEGNERWIQQSNRGIYDADGKIIGAEGICRNVTEQKKAEDKIKYQAGLLQNVSDAIISTDLDFTITTWNMAAERIFGWKEHEVINKKVSEVLKIEYNNTTSEEAIIQFRNNGCWVGEVIERHKDGTPITIYASINVIKDITGKEIGIVAINQDITEKKHAKEAQQNGDEQYRSLFENMLNGLAYCQMHYNDQDRPCDFTFLTVNKAFESLTGLRNVTGKKVSMVIPGILTIDPKLLDIYGRVAKAGQPERFEMFVESLQMWFWISVYSPKRGYFVAIFDVITERKKAEDALIKSEEKFRLLFDGSPSGIALVDPNGIIKEVNNSLLQLLSIQKEGIVGKNFAQLVSAFGLDVKENIKDFNNRLSEEPSKQEITFPNRNNCRTTIAIQSSVIRIGDGILGVLYILEDITERKKMEEKIKENDAKLSNAVKIAHLGPWEYDVINDIFTFTDPFYEIFRTTVEQVGGYTMSSIDYANRFVHPDDLSMVSSEIRKAVETDDPNFNQYIEHRIVYSNGEVGYISVRFFIVKDAKGRTIRTYGVNQDITERKKAEQQIQESQEKYKRLFDSSPNLITETDEEGNILSVNSALAKSIGIPTEKLIGKNILNLLPKEIAEQRAKIARTALEEGKNIEYEDERGGRFFYNIYVPIIYSSGKKTIQLIARDITDQKNAEKALSESEEKYRNVVERAHDGIVILQDDVIIKYVNPQASNILGYYLAEIIGTPINKYVHPDEIPKIVDNYKRRLAGESIPRVYESALVHKNGKRIDVELSGAVIVYQGKPADMIMIHDITERKKAEEALKEKINELERFKKVTVDRELKMVELKNKIIQLQGRKEHDAS